jgi:hypothetical protein
MLPWFISILICLRYKYGSILWLEDGNLYLRLRKVSHTIYATNGKVTHIHRRMCERDYIIDKSLVCLQSERRTSCYNLCYHPGIHQSFWADVVKGNVSYCHQLIRRPSVNCSHFNLLLWNPLAQMNWSLVGSIYVRFSIKIVHFVLIH